MKRIVAAIVAALLLNHPVDGTTGSAQPESRTARVQFGKGTTSKVVKGKPVASASTDLVTFSRKGDLSIVCLGMGERFGIPDALVIGG
jgi:hypothetical protein